MDDVLSKAKIVAGGWTQKHLMIRGLQRMPVFNKGTGVLVIPNIGEIKLPDTLEMLENEINNPERTADYTLNRLRTQFYEDVMKLVNKSKKGETIEKPLAANGTILDL